MRLERSLLEGNFEIAARRNQRGICQACEESDAKNKELMGEQVINAESIGVTQ